MDNKMYQDEFEEFLQSEVKDHRMYPSDQIWRNIQNRVHGPQSWPALTFISLFIISAITVATVINNHPIAIPGKLVSMKKMDSKKQDIAPPINEQDKYNVISANQVTAATIANIAQEQIKENESIVNTEAPVISLFDKTVEKPTQIIVGKFDTEKSSLNKSNIEPERTIENLVLKSDNQTINTSVSVDPLSKVDESLTNTTSLPIAQKLENNTLVEAKRNESAAIISSSKNEHSSTDEFLKDFSYNSIKSISNPNSKFGFGFYITPSSSYRRLSDLKAKEILGVAPASAPVGLNYTSNINQIVRQKPAMGLEIGFSALYNMTNRLKFKTGIQFNIRQYYIETFQSNADMTTLSLVNSTGVENVSVLSLYNNNNGYKNAELDNRTYQVSIPIGFQYDIFKGKHLGLTADATIQPTFTLNKSLYLLSTDYKHYADGNSLMRKWNINSSVGINLTYQIGIYQWFLGPQARFQHLPTYSNTYPIKEYLMDYGIHIGFIKKIN